MRVNVRYTLGTRVFRLGSDGPEGAAGVLPRVALSLDIGTQVVMVRGPLVRSTHANQGRFREVLAHKLDAQWDALVIEAAGQ